MQTQRTSLVDQLSEKNKRIEEILVELHKDREIFEPKRNILENPDERIM